MTGAMSGEIMFDVPTSYALRSRVPAELQDICKQIYRKANLFCDLKKKISITPQKLEVKPIK